MKKILFSLFLLCAPLAAMAQGKAVAEYNAAAAKENARNDVANWMSYLPDDLFVAHVSIPGTHDTATAEGWKSSTGPSYSTTQEKNIDEQLAGGIRAFDFRPGMVSGELWCNHGTDQTTLKLADAFTKLKNFLDAHPGEFFVMHLFRGNIFRSGEAGTGNKLLGAKDDAASQAQYNQLFNQLFNEGQFADYFIEYSPYLKVKDVRGKIIVFRRDRIDFAHVFKAGNLSGWPGAEDKFSENSTVSVTLDADPTVKGIIRATDVSSPDNETELQIELDAMRDLFAYNCNQTVPNEAKRQGAYKPYWSMIFTSGAYNGENTNGYLKNATYTNPYFTQLIKDSEKKGPTGIVFSDWVLTDSHDGNATMGVELVPTIFLNNFDYVSEYMLDDELFSSAEVENFWEDGKEYFIRNVATGEFMSVGADWGTHAVVNKDPIRIRLIYDSNNNLYNLASSLSNDGSTAGLGDNWYFDNPTMAGFTAKRVSAGIFSFLLGENAVAPTTHGNTYADGTVYLLDGVPFDESDTMQQWEVIGVDEYFKSEASKASKTNGVDVSYMIRGHKFLPNDADNWKGETKYYKPTFGSAVQSYIVPEGTNASTDKELVLHFYNSTYSLSNYAQYTQWSLTHTDRTYKAGYYKLRFKAAQYNFNLSDGTLTFNVNGIDIKPYLSNMTAMSANDAAQAVTAFRNNPDAYTVELDLELDENGEITFNLSKGNTKSITGLFLDDIELIYYGENPQKKYEVLIRAMADATARVNEMGAPYNEGWDLSEYEAGIDAFAYDGDGSEQALEIYNRLREIVYSQTIDDTEVGNYTGAIINPSFETGTGLGWNYTEDNDTGVKENANETYKMEGTYGDYLFNTWDNDKGVVLSQTIPGLPAGHYRLRATVASDQGNYVFFDVNGQRSEPLEITRAKDVGAVLSFDFDIAANTEEITISILGGDGQNYNELGGCWFKVDKFELTRHGEQKVCFFYDRLQKAIDRTNQIAAELPDKYRLQWDPSEYRDLYDKHIQSGHVDDPMDGSNGLAEVEELYSRLRTLIFSQTETGADMSGAITNQSFELGDLTGWQTSMEAAADTKVTPGNAEDVYKTEGVDGNYLFNSFLNNKANPIVQTISGVPAGKYSLAVKLASDAGNAFYIAVNGTPSEMLTTTGSGAFDTVSMEFEIEEDGADITLGVYPAINGAFSAETTPAEMGAWYKADDFRLTFLGKNIEIEWEMETDTHGTIILPFEAEVPEDLEIHTVSSSSKTEVKGENVNYHILTTEAKDKIEANTPYLVKKKAVATRAASGRTYTFTGTTTNTTDKYTDGLLTGVLAETSSADADRVLGEVEGNPGFHKQESTAIAPYHAYIAATDANVTDFYLEEPTLPIEWTMDTQDFGTIILPFEADVPEGLTAYRLTDLEETVYFTPAGTNQEVSYQLIVKEEADKLLANTPYLLMTPSAIEDVNGENLADAFSATADENENLRTETFRGVATNTDNTYSDGILTGVFSSQEVPGSNHVLIQNEEFGGFRSFGEDNVTTVPAYHAYVPANSDERGTFLLFAAPTTDNEGTGVKDLLADSNRVVDVYTTGGTIVKRQVSVAEALTTLEPGIYILTDGTHTAKLIKR